MPVRLYTVVGFVLIAFASASQVSAGWFCDIFNSIARDVKRRQCWPEPFLRPDRVAARAPYVTMVANGWRRQNMLGEYHFKPSTGQLTEAGRIRVRWILTAGPQQHRFIYVHRARTKQETSARIASVMQLAGKISPKNMPPVMATSISDQGWPAEEIEAISRKWRKTIPAPRLPPPASANTSAGTGAT